MSELPVAQRDRIATRTQRQIVSAGISCIARDGLAQATMAVIAAESGVSKALLHYHYADRSRLLAEVTHQLVEQVVARERAMVASENDPNTVSALWRWLAEELRRGELRAFLELGTMRDPVVESAIEAASQRRQRAASRTVHDVFRQLGLTPRVPPPLIGATHLALVDGLMMDRSLGLDEAQTRFDVFWGALLALVE